MPQHRTIDTLRFARHKFDFNFNRLGDLGEFLGLGKKVRHWGFDLWDRCMKGDLVAWELMKRYNKGDVRLLRKVYFEMRPWMVGHPNMSGPDKHPGCPICRSIKLIPWGTYPTKWGRVQRFHCDNCGSWPKGKYIEKEKRWRFLP